MKKETIDYFEAVRNNNVDHVKRILDKNPDLVNQRILGDATLLNSQIWMNKEIVDIQPTEMRSAPAAIHYSVFHGHYDMVKLLLERGADIN